MSKLTALDPLRPWFSAASLIFLAIASWRLYGPSAHCEAGTACADMRVLKRRRAIFWVAAVTIALLLLFPYYITWFV
jgi:mercuric ion transport protein